MYALAVAVFGGSTQFVVASLIGFPGSLLVPGWYLPGAAVAGFAAMIMARETAFCVV
jgi:MFS transporter, MHS family, citrate/tricarballylate:H+ symporter